MTEPETDYEEKLLRCLEELSLLVGKNCPKDFSRKWEKMMFSIVTELVERAMDEGAVTFKQVAIYVRKCISESTTGDTDDEPDIDLLQGAYIAISGRHRVHGVTSKAVVVAIESVEELIDEEDDWETEELAEMEAEYQEWAMPLSRCYRELGSSPKGYEPLQDGPPAPAEDAVRIERPT
jgi:hypothetical protein